MDQASRLTNGDPGTRVCTEPRPPRRPAWPAFVLAFGLAGCASGGGDGGAAGGGAQDLTARLSRIESQPPGASVFVDGAFVGKTPVEVQLPARRQVELSLDLPDHQTVNAHLARALGVPADAGPGVGWEAVYYYPLTPK
jgi:hypothetical protein